MCAPTVKNTQQNYGTATEKFAFEYDKYFNGSATNLHQQNPCMASGIVFVTIPYCTTYYFLYQEFLTVSAYPYLLLLSLYYSY